MIGRNRISRRGWVAIAALVAASGGSAFVVNTDENQGLWPDGTITYQVRLGGSASGTLIDGSTSWTTVAQAAANEWNQHLQNVQLNMVEAAVDGQNDDDQVNDLFFSDTVYGDSFGGSTLAITLNRFSGFSRPLPRTEADIVFNNQADLNWNSYRGPRRFDVDDLRRVLIHELGHALGLDHPDESGQSVSAVMNAFVSDIDTVATDDILGGQSLYGVRASSGGGGGGGGGSTTGGKLSNLSVRAKTGGAFGTLILGFATGTATKEVLIRGMGPSLAGLGVPAPIGDPEMRMFDQAPVEIDANNDWVDSSNAGAIGDRGAALGAFPPTSDLEAILLRTVTPGPYTVLVTDTLGRTGEVLIEAYDADALSATGRLTNLSTRTVVGGEAGLLTAGFVVDGSGGITLLIRGVGPTLSGLGVSNAIGDPRIRVLDSNQQEVAANDDWALMAASEKRTAAAQVGAFALDEGSLDAALLVTLQPGAYTVQMDGFNGASGDGLVEIYEVP